MIRILLAALALGALAEQEKMKPVEKVIGLIEKLQEETEQEGVAEATGYDKFACFCKAQADTKLKNIANAEAKITKLKAKIKKRSSEITQLDTSVADSNKEIKKLTKECEAEAKIRSDDHHEFTIKKNDIVQAIDGTEGAIEMMEASKAASFLQMKPVASKISWVVDLAIEKDAFHPKSQREADLMTSLAQLDQDPAQAKMDAAMGSKFHSNEIIESLMSILKDFKVRKNEIETSEADQKHTFDMAQSSRMNQLQSFKDQVDRTEEIIASKEEDKNKCEKEKASTEADKEADETFLEELVKTCEKTADTFDQRSKARSNEMAALAEALTILKGKVAETYGANKKTQPAQHSHKTR
jgi:peptidoglycan hydrolase CwlO-like protein